jgi:hypothetical protein
MPPRVHAPDQPRSPRRRPNPVAEAQSTIGNRAMTQLLARKGHGAKQATFEHSVRIGNLGPIEVKESNASDWTDGKSGAGDLVITTVKGKHSDKLKKMADGHERLDGLEITTVTGQNSWVTVSFKPVVIRGYEADGKTETWKATKFENVHIDRLSIGKPRP